MNILVVDDDQMILDAISHFLNTEGYYVITADDGFKALDILEKPGFRSDHQRYYDA